MPTIYVYNKKLKAVIAQAKHPDMDCCLEKVLKFKKQEKFGFCFSAKEVFNLKLNFSDKKSMELL